MNFKKIITILLGLVVAVAVVVIIVNGFRGQKEKEIQTEKQDTHSNKAAIENGIVVYYFHTTKRCQSCMKAEKLSKETVETFFKNEIDSGKIRYMEVNTDEPENSHYIRDYQLFSKSLIISLVKNSKEIKYKNLTEIWQLIYNDEGFKNYVKSEIENLIREM